MATCGFFATASRSASVRCAVSSINSRSGSGAMASSSSSAGKASPPTVMTATCEARCAAGLGGFAGAIGIGLVADAAFGIASGRLVLGPDIAAIHAKAAVFIDADERAGARDVGRLEPDRAILEFHERGLDLAHPLIHLVRQFVGVGVLGFEPVMFRVQGGDGRLFLSCEIERRAIQSAQVMVMAVGKIDRRLHPLPAFGGDRLRLGFQLLGHQAVEQADRFQPAARHPPRRGRA